MQSLINEYFDSLCTDTFFKNDYESIIGKAKDVITELKRQAECVKDNKDLDSEEIENIVNESNELIKEIQKEYPNLEDVIEISDNPMAGFYTLLGKEQLLEELEDYIDELEDD